MGRTHLFECAKCGFHAQVAGGAEEGLQFAVLTIACSDCKALYDAVIKFKPSLRQKNNPPLHAPAFTALSNRLPPRGVRSWLKYKPACPVAPGHRVRPWRPPDKCPKCGTFLELAALPFRVWD
ncbi:MAG TPA: hypothetical protein VMB80_08420 [Candidatus Acidoferrum sp.]|nr:hypothetical protein [Candidatus Acidoferrum sp.]